MTRDDATGDEPEPGESGVEDVFRAVVEQYEDRPDQCTIYATAASDLERMTTWITAREGSYFPLDNCR